MQKVGDAMIVQEQKLGSPVYAQGPDAPGGASETFDAELCALGLMYMPAPERDTIAVSDPTLEAPHRPIIPPPAN